MRLNKNTEDFKQLPLTVQLSALLDGELPDLLARQLRWRLQTDLELQAIMNQLIHGSEIGNRFFEKLLSEPTPLTFARAIRRGEGVAAKLSA